LTFYTKSLIELYNKKEAGGKYGISEKFIQE